MSNLSNPDNIELSRFPYERVPRRYSEDDTAYNPTAYDDGKAPIQHTSSWRTRFKGWRGGVLAACVVTLVVLLLNIILTVIAATVWNPVDGIATAYTGNCTTAARWTTAIHLLINLLSSLLLGASNYCMQRVVAPTRSEVDKSHAKKRWLDIGMPSVRNLTAINKERLALWFLLVLSSMPLHLVFNSAVFQTIAANNVDFLIVAPEFFADKNSWSYKADAGAPLTANTDNFVTQLQNQVLDGKYLDSTLFRNLTGSECVKRYGGSFITDVGAGYGVPVQEFRQQFNMSGSNSLLRTNSRSGDLDIQPYNGGPEYAYCLSEIVPLRCQVQFSLTILYIVIATNVIKALVMSLSLWRLGQEPLVTIGDAVKSFLNRPDPSTGDCCLMSRRNIKTLWETPEVRHNQRFQPRKREPWFGACSTRRWVVSISLYLSSIIVAGAFTGIVKKSFNDRYQKESQNSFGRVNVDFLIDVDLPFAETSIIPYVLLANLPQAIISFIYLTYNGLFTCMLANREWSQYSIKRAALRVTSPTANQRSTYFLQLPFSWSIPLLISSILLHWFVSQSIFLARIAVYKNGTPVNVINDLLGGYKHLRVGGMVFTGVGYSNMALLATIGWGSAMVGLVLAVAAFLQYPKGLPLGGTNSAVISAACHLKDQENAEAKNTEGEDVADKPLKWGVTVPGEHDRVGHCSFSPGEVDSPAVGCLYAGTPKEKGD